MRWVDIWRNSSWNDTVERWRFGTPAIMVKFINMWPRAFLTSTSSPVRIKILSFDLEIYALYTGWSSSTKGVCLDRCVIRWMYICATFIRETQQLSNMCVVCRHSWGFRTFSWCRCSFCVTSWCSEGMDLEVRRVCSYNIHEIHIYFVTPGFDLIICVSACFSDGIRQKFGSFFFRICQAARCFCWRDWFCSQDEEIEACTGHIQLLGTPQSLQMPVLTTLPTKLIRLTFHNQAYSCNAQMMSRIDIFVLVMKLVRLLWWRCKHTMLNDFISCRNHHTVWVHLNVVSEYSDLDAPASQAPMWHPVHAILFKFWGSCLLTL